MKLHSHYLLSGIVSCAALSACAAAPSTGGDARGRIAVVAVERVYADVAKQIGGDAVSVATILERPDADPHEYEPTTRDADAIARADVVVENGLGYDAFVDKLIRASPRDGRIVIDAGDLNGHRIGDNPHVWYEMPTLRALARRLADEFARRRPRDTAPFRTHSAAVVRWSDGFDHRLKRLGRRAAGERVAITEPVFDYVLEAAGIGIATPVTFSRAIEEGNDPAPQDVDVMRALIAGHRVRVLVYNDQTIEPSTDRLRELAVADGVAVVPVTETLPAAMRTQVWMEREVADLERAL